MKPSSSLQSYFSLSPSSSSSADASWRVSRAKRKHERNLSNTDRRKKVAGSLVAWPLLNRFSYRPRKSYGFHVYTMGMSLSKRLELAYEFFFFCNSKRASQVISRNRPMPIVRVNVSSFLYERFFQESNDTIDAKRIRQNHVHASIQDSRNSDDKKEKYCDSHTVSNILERSRVYVNFSSITRLVNFKLRKEVT